MAGFKSNKAKAGVYAYLITPTITTTPNTANEFTPVLGVFDNDPLDNFELAGDSLVCKCSEKLFFEIDWHAAFLADSANETVHFGVSINSEVLALDSRGVVGVFAKNAGQIYTVSGTVVVELTKGDTVQLQCASDITLSDITVDHFTATISKFFVNN